MLTLHVLSFGFVIGITALADKEALAWLRGSKQILEPQTLRNFHRFVWMGFFVLVASGLYLMYPMWRYLLSEPLFIMKMILVGVLFVNGVLIGRLQKMATVYAFKDLTIGQKLQLVISGMVSTFSWVSAALIALYLFN